MQTNPAYIHDLLCTVKERGAALAPKPRILWALGAKQDRPSAWRRLLDAWEELDEARDTLMGVENGQVIVLFTHREDMNIQPVEEWEG